MGNKLEETKMEPIQFKLTEAEKLQYGNRAALLGMEIETQRSNLKKETKVKKAEIDNLVDARVKLDIAIATGEEERTVECVKQIDFEAGKVFYLYRGEVVKERVMESHEAQLHIGQRRSVAEPERPVNSDVADVLKMETGKRTKTSSVDGPKS